MTLGPPKSGTKPFAIAAVLFALVGWTYLPCLRNEFISFDDPIYITSNAHVLIGFTGESMRWAWTSFAGGIWHPLTWYSIMLDCKLFGLKPYGHHLTSLLIHGANTALLFLALRRMSGATWRSAIVAALFGLHPLHVESVVWASERKDLLSAFFWLLTLLVYARYVQRLPVAGRVCAANGGSSSLPERISRGAKVDYGFTFLFFILGLMSKSMVVTLPLVLLLLDFWPLRRFESSKEAFAQRRIVPLLVEKIPFFAASIFCGLMTIHSQHAYGALIPMHELTFWSRFANGMYSYLTYLVQVFWPVDLAVFYPYPERFPTWQVLSVTALIFAVCAAVLRRASGQPYLAVGWFWYVVTLLPVIGFVQVGSQAHADRYTYLPLIGIFILLTWSAGKLASQRPRQQMPISLGILTIMLLCLGLTRRQISYWKDGETLFRHALAATKNNRMAHDNLGTTLLKKGRVDEALEHFREAIRIKPGDHEEMSNLGLVLLERGQNEEALALLQEVVRLRPDYAAGHANLGLALSRYGQLEEAVLQFQEALKLNPDVAETHGGLGAALGRLGRLDAAEAEFREALRLKPGSDEARCNLGVTLGRLGRTDEAIAQLTEALKLNPKNDEAHCSLGIALAQRGQTDQGIAEFRQALRLNPNYAEAHGNLGATLARQGKLDEGISHLQEALKLRPNYTAARTNLRTALAARDATAQGPGTATKP